MKIYFYDSETIGFYGLMVLLQYAINDGPIVLHHVWKQKISVTLKLIEDMMDNAVVGFNLSFDHFHLTKVYNFLIICQKRYGNVVPETLLDRKEELIEIEAEARDGVCLKPRFELDLMLHSQKHDYQHLMERKELRVRRIPEEKAEHLTELLNERVKFEDILFKRRKDPGANQWRKTQSINRKGDDIVGMYDIICTFAPSKSLKAISEDLGIVDEAPPINLPYDILPVELGYAPYAKAIWNIEEDQWTMVHAAWVRKYGKGFLDKLHLPYKGTWPHVIEKHIDMWWSNPTDIAYAERDVFMTRGLYYAFGKPEFNDDDSRLTSCVASSRWRGYTLDLEGIREVKKKAMQQEATIPFHRAPTKCLAYLHEVMNDIEKKEIGQKTNRTILEGLRDSGGELGRRAKQILDARQAKQEVMLYDKLLIAERFHASFNVIGTLSNRMSGSDALNPQGIKKDKSVRSKFPLAEGEYILGGGDFSGFEVRIFDAISSDPKLHEDLTTSYPCCNNKECKVCEGKGSYVKKIHALFGMHVYPDMTYEEICNSDGTADNKYTRAKSALFAMLYGGEAETLKRRLSVPLDQAQKAYDSFLTMYPGAKKAREAVRARYIALEQNPYTSHIAWNEPQKDVSSLYGFKRFFNLEFEACQNLYNLATRLMSIPGFRNDEESATISRRIEKRQTPTGACMSALFGAAFGIQGSVFRQAVNHEIQSSGAQITKKLQRNIWEIQPNGIYKYVVQPMNIHDEVMCPTLPPYINDVNNVVKKLLKEIRPTVPLIEMEWHSHMKNWSQK